MTLPRPSRKFVAEDVLAGRVDLTNYPFRYIFLTVPDRPNHVPGHAGLLARADVIFTAVELLETQGWEFLHVLEGGQVAYMRRRAA
jgi:hypothetical protein